MHQVVRVKAEKGALQQELDTQFAELRKFQEASLSKDGKVQMTDLELKRMKTQLQVRGMCIACAVLPYSRSQAEISRLKSRLAEVEAANVVLTDQLNRSMRAEATETQELQRQLDRSDHEVTRLQDRVREGEERARELQSRYSVVEREVLSLQDTIFKKDRAIKDLHSKIDAINIQRDEARASLEDEIDSVKLELSSEKQRYTELVQAHKKEIADMQRDVEKKLPSLAAEVAAQAEAHFSNQMVNEVSAVQVKYQRQIEALKQEMYDMQCAHKDALGRTKANSSDDKIELERLRQKCKLLESRHGDMEALVESLRQKERQQLLQLQWGGEKSGHSQRRSEDTDSNPVKHVKHTRLPHPKAPRVAFERMPAHTEMSSVGDDDSTLERFVDGETMTAIVDELAEMRKQLANSLQSTAHGDPLASSQRDRGVSTDHSSDSYINDSYRRPKAPAGSGSSREVNRLGSGRKSPARQRVTSGRSSSKDNQRVQPAANTTPGPSHRLELDDSRRHQEQGIQTVQSPHTPKRVPIKAAYTPETLFKSPQAPRESSRQHLQYADTSFSLIYPATNEPLDTAQSRYAAMASVAGLPIQQSLSNSSQDLSLLSGVDFSAIQDGGYHEGYWRAKYLRGGA